VKFINYWFLSIKQIPPNHRKGTAALPEKNKTITEVLKDFFEENFPEVHEGMIFLIQFVFHEQLVHLECTRIILKVIVQELIDTEVHLQIIGGWDVQIQQ